MGNDELIIKVENVCKEYKLGSLNAQSFRDEVFKKKKNAQPDKILKALDNVNFEIKKGETVGLIGSNGAGKSTILKILSRVTAPTSGQVYLNGSLSSMLEVGTGFHQELTGRENIYINGTILGMKKKEIDAKIEDIIEFSECREFIDTPVKRYSSGMYVKLAFSVSAFLESDILILDEVLAVGDMKFQNKCLEKMKELSSKEGRTILCVSHNMTTISKLCNRCIVLDHGKVKFDGDTPTAIKEYFGEAKINNLEMDYTNTNRFLWLQRDDVRLEHVSFIDKDEPVFWEDEKIKMHFDFRYQKPVVKLGLRIEIVYEVEHGVATAMLYEFSSGEPGESDGVDVEMDISYLRAGQYEMVYTLFVLDQMNESVDLDCVSGLSFEKKVVAEQKIVWKNKQWGSVELPELKLI